MGQGRSHGGVPVAGLGAAMAATMAREEAKKRKIMAGGDNLFAEVGDAAMMAERLEPVFSIEKEDAQQ